VNALTVIYKEWKEMLRSRLVLFNLVLLPGIFVSLPIALAIILMREGVVSATLATGEAIQVGGVQLTSADEVRIYLLHQSLFMFLMVPVFLPLSMAIYGVLHEKEQGTLEPLLTTPLTVAELMLGKSASIINANGGRHLAVVRRFRRDIEISKRQRHLSGSDATHDLAGVAPPAATARPTDSQPWADYLQPGKRHPGCRTNQRHYRPACRRIDRDAVGQPDCLQSQCLLARRARPPASESAPVLGAAASFPA